MKTFLFFSAKVIECPEASEDHHVLIKFYSDWGPL